MIRASIAATAGATTALVLTSAALARPAAPPTLTGTVGPGYTITLSLGAKKVRTLKAGTYKLVIHDRATIHAFSLDGPNGYANAPKLGQAQNTALQHCYKYGGKDCVIRAWICDGKKG